MYHVYLPLESTFATIFLLMNGDRMSTLVFISCPPQRFDACPPPHYTGLSVKNVQHVCRTYHGRGWAVGENHHMLVVIAPKVMMERDCGLRNSRNRPLENKRESTSPRGRVVQGHRTSRSGKIELEGRAESVSSSKPNRFTDESRVRSCGVQSEGMLDAINPVAVAVLVVRPL